jgi:hypothetical protein
MTMPGLPKAPSAEKIGLNEQGPDRRTVAFIAVGSQRANPGASVS